MISYSLSKKSDDKLNTCHPDLQLILRQAIKIFDFTVLVGFRNESEQNAAFEIGNSNQRWPTSKHNSVPSMAVDIAPYPIDWKDLARFYYLAGLIIGIANKLLSENKITHRVRWGGCWKMDNDFKNNGKPNDLGHFELIVVK